MLSDALMAASAPQVSPPVILLDMDGVVVDWDSGFYKARLH